MSSAIVAAAAGAAVSGMMSDDGGGGGGGGSADAAAQMQAEIARQQWDRYNKYYSPLEISMIDEANNAGSPTEYAQAAGDASATVAQQFGKARDRMSRTPGLDPSSPAAQASLVGLDMAQAASDATQQNVARMNVKNTAWAKKSGMLGMGKGLDTTAASSLGAASSNLANIAAANNSRNAANGAAMGRITDRVVSGLGNWLGNNTRGGGGGGNVGYTTPGDTNWDTPNWTNE